MNVWIEILIIYVFILLAMAIGGLVLLNMDEINKASIKVFGDGKNDT